MSKSIQLADCCNGDCRQGRDCPRPPLFPMHGLHTDDGGHKVNGGISFPLQPGEGMEQDEPLYSCDSVMELLPSWVAWLLVVAASVCMAIACGWLDPLFPR